MHPVNQLLGSCLSIPLVTFSFSNYRTASAPYHGWPCGHPRIIDCSSESLSSFLFLRRIASFSAVSKVLAAGYLFPPEMAFLAIQGFILAFKFCASCLASCMPSPHGGGWGWYKCYTSCLTSWQLSHEGWSLGKKYPLFDSSYILLLSFLP